MASRKKVLLKVCVAAATLSSSRRALRLNRLSPCAGDHPGRQRRRQDQLNEPIRMVLPHACLAATDLTRSPGQQEILHLLQSHHRRRFPDQRSHRRRPDRDPPALGHRRPRALPVPRRGLLPRRRLLRARLRRQQHKVVRDPRLLARRVPHPGQPRGTRRVIPVRGAGEQDRYGRRSADGGAEARAAVLSESRVDAIL